MSNETDSGNLCDARCDPWTPRSDKSWLNETTLISNWILCSNIKNLMAVSTGSRCRMSSSSYSVDAASSSRFAVRHPRDNPFESEIKYRLGIKSRRSSRDRTTRAAFRRWSLERRNGIWWPRSCIKMLTTPPSTSSSRVDPPDRTQMSISATICDELSSSQRRQIDEFACVKKEKRDEIKSMEMRLNRIFGREPNNTMAKSSASERQDGSWQFGSELKSHENASE